MALSHKQKLAAGYTCHVDEADEKSWGETLQQFDDANIYQTWPYASVTAGKRNVGHVTLRQNGEIVAVAQARITRVPLIGAGIAYVLWGPLWKRSGQAKSLEVFRQIIRALRNEFVCKRGLALRLSPMLFDNDSSGCAEILQEEGFSVPASGAKSRTILMSLTPTLEELHGGMNAHWKRELKVAEKNKLEVLEGTEDELFAEFIKIYQEMVSRKRFVEPNDINQFRSIQRQLPEPLKMKIMLSKYNGEISSGLISSALGNSAVYLFGATSNSSMKSRGSYFLQWKFIERLKQAGTAIYDLNGINPAKNPGTYKFKNDLAGKNAADVYALGKFDACESFLSRLCLQYWDHKKSNLSWMQIFKRTIRSSTLREQQANGQA